MMIMNKKKNEELTVGESSIPNFYKLQYTDVVLSNHTKPYITHHKT